MNEKVIFELPHIKLVQSEKMEIIVAVEDTELNDYVEDFLWDNYGLDEYGIVENEKDNLTCYYNYYEVKDLELLIEALKSLDVKEIVRIFAINN
ncbi:hypothetical protein [Flavobacterium sedimenticola]|uniref:DUF4265 domain-containing protein n=1 Tax=Flavobacterium sedimenticola TaxID=3043286 RepID=A0ABT6XSG8_9FLAO|nr:hypothetical protein [Flavobacterium sedimenticola]MDI9257925.1 hypothetical protein [Flavobacterium sedimenticola]